MDKRMTTIYSTFYGGLSGLPAGFTVTGSYTEANLQDIVAHVEASTGESAIVVGTKKALGKVTTAIVSEQAKERYNQMGYYGVVNGTPMMSIKQFLRLALIHLQFPIVIFGLYLLEPNLSNSLLKVTQYLNKAKLLIMLILLLICLLAKDGVVLLS
jgi:hypothetical protein